MPLKLLFFIITTIAITSCSEKTKEISQQNGHKTEAKQYKWETASFPTSRQTKVYGGYSAGCIDGAVRLPEFGKGYVAAMAANNRLYGHPKLIKLIEDLSRTMKEKHGRTLLIGDLGQARGGPAPIHTSAHRSHQNGLDVDIWYRNINKDIIGDDDIYPESVLSFFKNKLSKRHWDSHNEKMLKYVAENENVERILLNPAVKKEMCKNYSKADWITKLRPWWGHDKHFHVRLKCPKYDKNCKRQAPVPNEESCGEHLDWWFTEEAKNMGKTKSETKRKYPNLPEQCEKVWVWKPIGTAKLQP